MAKPASPSRLLGSLIILALLLGSTTVFAQEAAKSPESDTPESEEAVFIPIEFRPPPWQVSVGLRLAGKAKVKFSGLGAIPNSTSYMGPNPAATADEKETAAYKYAQAYAAAYGRSYDDGSVSPDKTYVFSTLNGTEYTRESPTDGKTNVWRFASADQVVDMPGGTGKALAYHAYAVESDGTTASVEENGQMTWDIEISRELGSNRRMSWGLLFGASISDIRCKTDATIKSKLHTITDYYSLDGVTMPTNIANGYMYMGRQQNYVLTYTYDDVKDPNHTTPLQDSDGYYIYLKDADGNYVFQKDADGNNLIVWSSNPQRLPSDPTLRTDETESTASLDCIGHWEVKGAYMTARFGPYFAYQLTHRLALRASAGLTFTVVGARFFLNERVVIPAARAYTELDMQLTNESASFDAVVSGILGYYASGELNTFFTDRTGMFFGASYENFQRDLSLGSNYAGHQRADVSLSSGTILRTGITTRF